MNIDIADISTIFLWENVRSPSTSPLAVDASGRWWCRIWKNPLFRLARRLSVFLDLHGREWTEWEHFLYFGLLYMLGAVDLGPCQRIPIWTIPKRVRDAEGLDHCNIFIFTHIDTLDYYYYYVLLYNLNHTQSEVTVATVVFKMYTFKLYIYIQIATTPCYFGSYFFHIRWDVRYTWLILMGRRCFCSCCPP